MIVVTRHEIYDEQKKAIALMLGKRGEAKHKEIKSWIEAIVQVELDGAVLDYRQATPLFKTIENTGLVVGTVWTNGQKRPIYSARQIEKGKHSGRIEVEIKKGSGYKRVKADPKEITLEGGDDEK